MIVGEPDFLTPWHIRQAGIDNLAKGATRYTANAGLAELREEISRYYARKFLVKYDPTDEILVTVGGSEGIDMAIRSIISPGDEVLPGTEPVRSEESLDLKWWPLDAVPEAELAPLLTAAQQRLP